MSTILPLSSAALQNQLQQKRQLQLQPNGFPLLQPPKGAEVDSVFFDKRNKDHLLSPGSNSAIDNHGDGMEEMDDIVVEALESIRSHRLNKYGYEMSIPRPLSHREKSRRLLRQCSSWTQLEATPDSEMRLDGQGKSIQDSK